MGLNVLVVDDSVVMRAMIVKTLRLSGLPLQAIFEAGDGLKALHIIDENWIDLVLVDLNMPVMGGEEFLCRLRENSETADLPVIVVSTESSETRIAKLRDQGAGFVHKPFQPETLRDVVADLTGVSNESSSGEGALQGSGTDF
jgi:two-component system chemotaxis response regulator CheY